MPMKETKLAVPDIACNRCKATIEDAVRDLPGVAGVDADVAGWIVTVEHDPGRTPAALVASAVEGAGYRVADYEEVSP